MVATTENTIASERYDSVKILNQSLLIFLVAVVADQHLLRVGGQIQRD